MYPDLYLIRHGETVWNRQGRLQGLLDSPLTGRGRAQARALAGLVAGIPADRISSPQGRAVQTARLLFGGDDFTTDARLTEIDIGSFTGHLFDDLRSAHPVLFDGPRLAWYDRAPGGEHFAGLHSRAAAFLNGLRGPAIIVTHAITLRMLRSLAMGGGPETLDGLPVEQGAIHVVRAGYHNIRRPGQAL